MPRQIQGSQWNFSFGEVDATLKRADDHPARKAGLRQALNGRLLNSGSIQDRPGRRALFLEQGRIEKVLMSPGNAFDIVFGAGTLRVYTAAGSQVFTQSGFPWALNTVQSIVWAQYQSSIYITFPGMQPQVLSWDGVSTWSVAAYAETVTSAGQKRTFFYRISPRNITLVPGGVTGSVALTFSANVLKPGHVGTRMRYLGQQFTITSVTDGQHGQATCSQPLLGSSVITFAVDPSTTFAIGDEVIGATSGAKGIVASFASPVMTVANITAQGFGTTEQIVGPNGVMTCVGTPTSGSPVAVSVWDEEVMNSFQGWPASVFVDQNRLGFCNFPSVPSGIGWSAIINFNDMYVGANPSDAMFEIAPRKSRVLFVQPGAEGAEFVFCDNRMYYIPISVTNPLKPGSVAFQLMSGDGCAPVQPRLAQEAIIYINAGQNSVMAVIATGAYNRPFNTKNLSDFHAHLFNNIVCIATPSADGTFNERYAYILNGDGSIAVGKYAADSLQGNQPVIGWGPWSGAGTVSWIAAYEADVIFSSSYGGVGICEVLDDTQYLDCAISVNSLPAAFTPPGGKGPLWFIPSQSVTLMDQVTRVMGTYQVDANGFIVPQNNGGENLNIASLVAGQPWTMIVEPFAPDASSGADMGQRMWLRQISNVSVYVIHSSGLMIASLFSAMQTATSPALGTVMKSRRFTPWNQDDDATKPPTLRETVLTWTPPGSSYDPRVAFIKDTPGPLTICEIAMEITL